METSKRYACLTFEYLVESKTSHKKIQLRGFIPLIVKLLLEDCTKGSKNRQILDQLNLYYIFVDALFMKYHDLPMVAYA